jgi:endonuclease YncB( thermonuclease family)
MRFGMGIRVAVAAAALARAGIGWVENAGQVPIDGGTVVRVVDGDTIIVRGPGGRTRTFG